MEYQSPLEFAEALKKNINDNRDYYSPWEILEAMVKRWDTIRWINAWDVMEDASFANAIDAILKNPSNVDLSIFTEDELSLKQPEEEIEVTDLNSAMKSEWKTPIEAKEVWSDNNFEIFKNFWERYKQVHWEKKDLIDKYNWWKGYPDGSEAKKEYEQKLKIYNDTLNEMEDWEEFYNIVKSIKDYWIWWKNVIPEKVAMAIQTIADKEYSNDNDTKSITRSIFWNDYVDSWNATHTFDLSRSDIDKVLDNYLSSHKWLWWENKWKDEWEIKPETKSETKNNKNNVSVSNSPLKPTKITDEKVTDEMSFWDDVAWKWWEEYLKKRNIALATHLKQKWIETPEEIEAYLSKYPSWKNAKQEWRDNTINNLQKNMANIKWPEIKKEETKDETKEEKWVWDAWDVKNKDRLNKEKNDATTNPEAEESDIKKSMKDKIKDKINWIDANKLITNAIWLANNINYRYGKNDESPINDVEFDETSVPWKEEEPIWNWKPNNETPLNWTEEDWNDFWNNDSKKENNNSLRAKQYKDKWYTVKNGKFYTPSGVLVENNWNNLTETWERVPAKKTEKKPETKKSETKNNSKKVTKKDVEKVVNAAKSSPTIMNLLNKFKK